MTVPDSGLAENKSGDQQPLKKRGTFRKARRVGREFKLSSMKTDLYTKAVLTIIAVCLTILVFKQFNIIPNAYAEIPKNNLPVGNNYGLVPLNSDGSIDVNIKSNASAIDVNIVDISTSDELDVNIDEVGRYSTYGKVPVQIK